MRPLGDPCAMWSGVAGVCAALAAVVHVARADVLSVAGVRAVAAALAEDARPEAGLARTVARGMRRLAASGADALPALLSSALRTYCGPVGDAERASIVGLMREAAEEMGGLGALFEAHDGLDGPLVGQLAGCMAAPIGAVVEMLVNLPRDGKTYEWRGGPAVSLRLVEADELFDLESWAPLVRSVARPDASGSGVDAALPPALILRVVHGGYADESAARVVAAARDADVAHALALTFDEGRRGRYGLGDLKGAGRVIDEERAALLRTQWADYAPGDDHRGDPVAGVLSQLAVAAETPDVFHAALRHVLACGSDGETSAADAAILAALSAGDAPGAGALLGAADADDATLAPGAVPGRLSPGEAGLFPRGAAGGSAQLGVLLLARLARGFFSLRPGRRTLPQSELGRFVRAAEVARSRLDALPPGLRGSPSVDLLICAAYTYYAASTRSGAIVSSGEALPCECIDARVGMETSSAEPLARFVLYAQPHCVAAHLRGSAMAAGAARDDASRIRNAASLALGLSSDPARKDALGSALRSIGDMLHTAALSGAHPVQCAGDDEACVRRAGVLEDGALFAAGRSLAAVLGLRPPEVNEFLRELANAWLPGYTWRLALVHVLLLAVLVGAAVSALSWLRRRGRAYSVLADAPM